MAELRFALFGCGGMGKYEARILGQIPRARLVAVCDVRREAADAFGAEMGVPTFTDPEDVLRQSDVNAVIVATPNGLHTPLVLAALAAKKHVFCEKPMAFTVAECDAMIAAAESNGVRLMVGQVLRLLPLFSRVIAIVDDGRIGTPVAAQITRIGWFGEAVASYRLRKEIAGGLLYEITVHEIDLVHRLLGPTRSVYAQIGQFVVRSTDYEDTAQLVLRHQGGAVTSIFESTASVVARSVGTIVGEKGTLTYDHPNGRIAYRLNAARDDEIVETVARADGEDGYLRELRSFVEWALDGTEPILSWREGRAAIAVVEAAYRSAQTGQSVEPA